MQKRSQGLAGTCSARGPTRGTYTAVTVVGLIALLLIIGFQQYALVSAVEGAMEVVLRDQVSFVRATPSVAGRVPARLLHPLFVQVRALLMKACLPRVVPGAGCHRGHAQEA